MEIEKNNEESLKKLLRESGEEKAPVDFTETVLKSIQVDLQSQAVGASSLKSLLQQHAVEQPSVNFQLSIMEHLAVVPSVQYKPIISRKTWYGIAAAVALLLVACYFYPSAAPVETPRALIYLDRAFGYVLKFSNIPRGTVEISVMTLIGLSVLLLADFFLRQKLSSFSKLARS